MPTVRRTSPIQPALLGKINERQVLRTIQARGPLSRAEVARESGVSAPTASKAVEALLRAGLLEEGAAPELARGRPGKKLRLATQTAQVLGLVIDAEDCRVVTAGLDGKLHKPFAVRFDTPPTYEELIYLAATEIERLIGRTELATLGLGISMPGLLDYRHQRGVLSPNVPITNGHSPSLDLAERLGVECVLVQEAHGLCLAERNYGQARGLDDFAMLEVGTGVGLGVMSGGRLLTGNSGLAGELGHITAELEGRPCGCGNRGCLETVACDNALAWTVSQRLGRKVSIRQVLELVHAGEVDLTEEVRRTCRYLSVTLAAAINLFNPSTLFVHGKLLDLDETFFAQVVEETRSRALGPSFAECRIIRAQGSRRLGAVAAIIEHLTNSLAPELEPERQYAASAVAAGAERFRGGPGRRGVSEIA
jgi:N-acetylglucosamine repressor